jgi:Protein of unknown function (DUF3618)
MTRKSGTAADSELQADVEHAREELAHTVAELAGKADVRAHARDMAANARSRARREMYDAKARMRHTAEGAADRGFTKPGPAMAVVGGVGAAALAVYLLLRRQQHQSKSTASTGIAALGERMKRRCGR